MNLIYLSGRNQTSVPIPHKSFQPNHISVHPSLKPWLPGRKRDEREIHFSYRSRRERRRKYVGNDSVWNRIKPGERQVGKLVPLRMLGRAGKQLVGYSCHTTDPFATLFTSTYLLLPCSFLGSFLEMLLLDVAFHWILVFCVETIFAVSVSQTFQFLLRHNSLQSHTRGASLLYHLFSAHDLAPLNIIINLALITIPLKSSIYPNHWLNFGVCVCIDFLLFGFVLVKPAVKCNVRVNGGRVSRRREDGWKEGREAGRGYDSKSV